MLEKYRDLNDKSKEFLLNELNNYTNNKIVLDKCYEEINDLYDKGILFIIEYLYIYKKDNEYVNYRIHGLKKSVLLSTLGLIDINSFEYDKTNDELLHIEFINSNEIEFIKTVHVCNGGDFRFFRCSNNNYLIIPSSSLPYDITFKYDKELNDIDILSVVGDCVKDCLIIKMNK